VEPDTKKGTGDKKALTQPTVLLSHTTNVVLLEVLPVSSIWSTYVTSKW